MPELVRVGRDRPGVPIPLEPQDTTPKNPHYPRLVEIPGADKCHDCSKRTEIVYGQGGSAHSMPAGPDKNCPFCKGTGGVPKRVLAKTPAHHSSLVGYEVGEDGERLYPLPPTVEEYTTKGVPLEDAKRYAAAEAAKASKGLAPYGPLPQQDAPKAKSASVGKDPLSEEF